MRVNIKLFSVSFIFAVLSGINSGIFQYFSFYWMNLPNFQYLGILTALQITTFLISPIGILVVFYYLGKKYDLPKLIGEAVISVFSGLVIGFYLTNITLYNISIYISPPTSMIAPISFYSYMIILAIIPSVSMFFVIFASLAIGYFRRTEKKGEIPSSDKSAVAESSL